MVFHWSLNDCKSLHFSRILRIIRANLNNDLVWMVSIRPLISNSFYQSFRNRSKCANYNWYHRHPHVPQLFFSSLTRSKYLFLFFFSLSLIFTLRSTETTKFSTQSVLFSFLFVNYSLVCSTGGDQVIIIIIIIILIMNIIYYFYHL